NLFGSCELVAAVPCRITDISGLNALVPAAGARFSSSSTRFFNCSSSFCASCCAAAALVTVASATAQSQFHAILISGEVTRARLAARADEPLQEIRGGSRE